MEFRAADTVLGAGTFDVRKREGKGGVRHMKKNEITWQVMLIDVGLTLLAVYPERVNGLTREVCSGKIRQYTLRMVRMVKLVFVEGLLFTSVCDALGKELKQGYSLIIVVLIAAIAVYYEGRIIHILKQNNKR